MLLKKASLPGSVSKPKVFCLAGFRGILHVAISSGVKFVGVVGTLLVSVVSTIRNGPTQSFPVLRYQLSNWSHSAGVSGSFSQGSEYVNGCEGTFTVAVGVGVGVGVATGVGVAEAAGAGFATATPLFHTNFLPLFTHVYFLPL